MDRQSETMQKKRKTDTKDEISTSQEKLKNKNYLRELALLHVELVKL